MKTTLDYSVIKAGGSLHSIDLAAALFNDIGTDALQGIIEQFNQLGTTLYLPAKPSELGTGDVASNFRYKHDMKVNREVIDNWLTIFKTYSENPSNNPVVITAVDRTERLYTFQLGESGEIDVIHNQIMKSVTLETKIMKEFLESSGITHEDMKNIRMATKDSDFRSYGADMIATITMVNWMFHPEIFKKEYLTPYIVSPEHTFSRAEVSGQPMLQPVVIRGKEWKPKEGFDYLYFKDPSYNVTNQCFMVPDPDCMPKIYHQLFEALSNEENGTKKMIREFFLKQSTFSRLSDFWLNDVDDGFTILMIIHCFKFCSLSTEEEQVRDQFIEISKPWFEELHK
uniref:Uncharacterized protein n=1 Tax=viral metagenome TaxID=1070528 RepID=A0A6C0L3D3_9ZZZZ|tara:strand:+ start:6419 stop:7441 length:1023 start_codon:yes stop_codon:yes gene_type:complete